MKGGFANFCRTRNSCTSSLIGYQSTAISSISWISILITCATFLIFCIQIQQLASRNALIRSLKRLWRLVPGSPAVAMSVMLTSMLNTSIKFNALKIIIESHKLDLNEPLIFHLWKNTLDWRYVIVDPAVMALLLDKMTNQLLLEINCYLRLSCKIAL